MADPSAGEVGGVFAGAVALIVALGHGIRWWLGWTDRRAATRSAKLDAWQNQLDERETRIEAQQLEYWAGRTRARAIAARARRIARRVPTDRYGDARGGS
jgi:uncharacterized protein HemX